MPTHQSSSNRVIVYNRVSSPGQSSLADQERWARRLAESNGWTVVDVISDDGISGDQNDRAGLMKLEAAFRDHQRAGCTVDRLMVWHTDRLSRSDTLDAFALLARLRSLGLRYVITNQREIDLQNRLDRTLYALEQDHASNPYLKQSAERVLNGMAEVAKAGFWVGRTPIGYNLVRVAGEHGDGKRRRSGHLAIDPETAPVIAELFRRYVDGESTVGLARWLTAQVKPHHAVAWSPQTVRTLIMNQVYMGTQTFGKRSRGKHARLTSKGAETRDDNTEGTDNIDAALIFRNAVPAIVDEDTFRRAQDRLRSGRRRSQKKSSPPLPLSGLGTCGHCRGRLHISYHTRRNGQKEITGRFRLLVCANRKNYGPDVCAGGPLGIRHDTVLLGILKHMAAMLLDNGSAEKLAAVAGDQAETLQRQQESQRQALTRQISQYDTILSRSQERLMAAPADLIEDYQAGIRRIKQQRADAAAELEKLHHQTARPEFDPERFRAFWQGIKHAQDLAKQDTFPPSMNALMGELIDGFTLW